MTKQQQRTRSIGMKYGAPFYLPLSWRVSSLLPLCAYSLSGMVAIKANKPILCLILVGRRSNWLFPAKVFHCFQWDFLSHMIERKINVFWCCFAIHGAQNHTRPQKYTSIETEKLQFWANIHLITVANVGRLLSKLSSYATSMLIFAYNALT